MWEDRKLPLQGDLIVPILNKYLALPVCYHLEDQMGAKAETATVLLVIFFQNGCKNYERSKNENKVKDFSFSSNYPNPHYLDFD